MTMLSGLAGLTAMVASSWSPARRLALFADGVKKAIVYVLPVLVTVALRGATVGSPLRADWTSAADAPKFRLAVVAPLNDRVKVPPVAGRGQ